MGRQQGIGTFCLHRRLQLPLDFRFRAVASVVLAAVALALNTAPALAVDYPADNGAVQVAVQVADHGAEQAAANPPNATEHHRADLEGAPGMEVIVSTAEYRRGDSIHLHRHHGVEALYVIQGATVQSPGKAPHEIPTGASLLNLRDVYHAGFTVVGDTPLKLFTVHVVDKGKPLYEYAQED